MRKPLTSKTEQKLRDGRVTTITEKHTQSIIVQVSYEKSSQY